MWARTTRANKNSCKISEKILILQTKTIIFRIFLHIYKKKRTFAADFLLIVYKMEKNQEERREQEIVYSRSVKAGKRIYYLDVRKARNNDLYLSITESKRRQTEGEEAPSFEKHKLFLYKEDFAHFVEGLQDVIGYVQTQLGDIEARQDYVPEQDAAETAEATEEGEEPKKKGFLGFLRK